MNAARYQRVSEIFLAAVREGESTRAALLESACGADFELRREVESLLSHHSRTSGLMVAPALGSEFRLDELRDRPTAFDGVVEVPRQIGRYRILRVLGEGGMGVVYLAEQENPRRTVALKVIKPGVMSGRALKRFEHEAQMLGRLQHPGIAQILEAGTAEVGDSQQRRSQPYFAMEYVRGQPLLAYAAAHQLSPRQRLELFVPICAAVQHAHQHGVVHRDLKPSNILADDEGRLKVLDFGVARSTESDVQATTLQTDIGQLIGTIPYMSPEQATGDSRKVDARSDVYALAVICYELLTGRLPHDLRDKSIPEAVRIIGQEEPTPLSSINRIFRGDLNTIIAKGLEKDPARRYQSASELALDLQRYLDDQPIIARPASAWYQFSKFARRNTALVGGISAVFLVLVAGLIVSGVLLGRALNAEDLAVNRLRQAKYAEQLAVDRLAAAEHEQAKAEATKHFLQDMLSAVNPVSRRDKEVTVREMLDVAAAKIDAGSMADKPETEASIRFTIGTTYRALGRYAEAERHLRRMVELRRMVDPGDSLLLANGLGELAQALWRLDDLDGAEQAYRESLEMKRRLLGEENAQVATTLNGIAVLLADRGDLDGSERLQREALEIRVKLFGREHEHVALSLSNLGSVLQDKGDLAQAETCYREALETRRRLHGNEYFRVAETLNNLASLTRERGDLEAAMAFATEALDIKLKIHDRSNSTVGVTLINLCGIHRDRRELDEAEARASEALAIMRAAYSQGHTQTANALVALASVCREQGRFDEAEVVLGEAIEMTRQLQGEAHPLRGRLLAALGDIKLRRGDAAVAATLLREAVAIQQRTLPEGHPHFGASLGLLGEALLELGAAAEAEPLLVEALAIRQRVLVPANWRIGEARCLLGACLAAGDKADEAETMLVQGLEALERSEHAPANRRAWAMRQLAALYQQTDEPELAAFWQVQAGAVANEPLPRP